MALSTSNTEDSLLQSFKASMDDTVVAGFKLIGLGFGQKLGLFKAFDGTMTSAELAAKSSCKERYVREWLHQMVLSDVADVDDTGTLFSLPAHRQQVLTGSSCMVNILGPAFPLLTASHDELLDCVRINGPNGLAFEKVYPFFKERALINHSSLAACADFIRDTVRGLKSKLENGIRVCEIGCANSAMLLHLAKQFPKSLFLGIDLSPDFIAQAQRELAADSQIQNVTLLLQDASNLPEEWNNSLDAVIMRDVLHDISHASKALASFFRVLKPGGQLALFEVNVSSNPHKTLQSPDRKFIGQMVYCLSTYHCLPASLSVPGSEGLGLGAGIEKIGQLIADAGFILADNLPIGDFFNVLFVGQKPICDIERS